MISRRRFLGVTATTGTALVTGSLGSLLALRGCAPDVPGLRVLSAQEYRTVSMLARALFPEGGPFRFGAGDCDLARAFDDFLADEPPWNQRDLKRALNLLEFGPLLFDHRWHTFSHLPEPERLAHFQRWATSDRDTQRQVATALRKFMCLVFYDSPRVWPSIGYDGPRFRRVEPT